MAQNITSVEPASSVYWPWFVGGLLYPVCGRVFASWLPPYFAAGLSFFILFAAASFVVARLSHPRRAGVGRHVTASATGGILVGFLTYAFP
jgi:hypothetical protein